MSFFLGLVVGVAVGWHFPQPQWARDFWDKVKAKFGK